MPKLFIINHKIIIMLRNDTTPFFKYIDKFIWQMIGNFEIYYNDGYEKCLCFVGICRVRY